MPCDACIQSNTKLDPKAVPVRRDTSPAAVDPKHPTDMLLAVVAGHLEQSERDILNLRSQQGRFEERVAMMQGLLKVGNKGQLH